MEQQGQIQLQMYRELQKKYDQSCSIMHDINRHLNMLEQQTKAGRTSGHGSTCR